MHITIAEKLRPFSHLPGTRCILPFSNCEVRVFPALLIVGGKNYPQNVKGPVKDFTVQLDLEKGCVRVWGHALNGFFRYSIHYDSSVKFEVEKDPGNQLQLPTSDFVQPLPISERLSLGCHKAQDWELVTRRGEMIEVFPFWHRLGKMIKPNPVKRHDGLGKMLLQCEQAIANREKTKIVALFQHLFQAAFHGILAPSLQDELHQGFLPAEETIQEGADPFILLNEGSRLIRSLFIRAQEKTTEILPLLPPEFHCGRLLNADIPAGKISIEWSKKEIRRAIFDATTKENVKLLFPKEIKQFRIRDCLKQRGIIHDGHAWMLETEPGKRYFLDNFQK